MPSWPDFSGVSSRVSPFTSKKPFASATYSGAEEGGGHMAHARGTVPEAEPSPEPESSPVTAGPARGECSADGGRGGEGEECASSHGAILR